MSKLTQIARIFLENIAIFLASTFLVFALIRSIPGDIVTDMLGPGASEEAKQELRHQLGLDRPLLIQYMDRLWKTVTFDLGISGGQKNTDLIVHSTKVTLLLTLGATALLLILAIPIGLLSGLYPRNWLLNLGNFGIYVLSMLPVFLLAYGSFFLFNFVPILSDVPEIANSPKTSLSENQLYVLIYCTMIFVLAFGDGTITELIRTIREETMRILESDFIRAVRANGGSVLRHLAKNLFAPIATVINLRILYLLGGAVVIESVYEFPGLGRLTLEAVGQREYNLIFSVATISVMIVLVITLINKVLITFVDPRTRE